MDLTKMKRSVGQCDDIKDLSNLGQHIKKRVELLRKREWAATVSAVWNEIKDCKAGDVLYVTCRGAFVGGSIQRGDALKVSCLQPRAKRIWFYGKDGEQHAFYMGCVDAARYKLSKTQTDNPMSEESKAIHERMGERFREAGLMS